MTDTFSEAWLTDWWLVRWMVVMRWAAKKTPVAAVGGEGPDGEAIAASAFNDNLFAGEGRRAILF